MKNFIQTVTIIASLSIGCNRVEKTAYDVNGDQSRIIAEMINAVNEKDPNKYVMGFSDTVQVYVESELKVNGKENLKNNRAKHFENHPNVRSEIQHLVEIDNKVILHDKVWLDDTESQGRDIVEIFTFKEGEVVRVDVIQPKNLFQN